MYNSDNITCKRIERLISESESYVRFLYVTPCIYTRNMLLYQLESKICEIGFLSSMLCSKANQIKSNHVVMPQLNQQTQESLQNQQNQREFTQQELAKYNGLDGNPAYVAVNGVVYDVTNNAAWAAASHFGLTAGKDLTSEFASCHAGQTILNKLKVVGKLI